MINNQTLKRIILKILPCSGSSFPTVFALFLPILNLVLHLLPVEPEQPLAVGPQLAAVLFEQHAEVVGRHSSYWAHFSRLQWIVQVAFVAITTNCWCAGRNFNSWSFVNWVFQLNWSIITWSFGFWFPIRSFTTLWPGFLTIFIVFIHSSTWLDFSSTFWLNKFIGYINNIRSSPATLLASATSVMLDCTSSDKNWRCRPC